MYLFYERSAHRDEEKMFFLSSMRTSNVPFALFLPDDLSGTIQFDNPTTRGDEDVAVLESIDATRPRHVRSPSLFAGGVNLDNQARR